VAEEVRACQGVVEDECIKYLENDPVLKIRYSIEATVPVM
jgi:hypothetical protein